MSDIPPIILIPYQPTPIRQELAAELVHRHAEPKVLMSCKLEGKRAINCRADIVKYFAQLQSDIEEFNIKLENMWNMNEVGLGIVTVETNFKVLGSADSEEVTSTSPETREWVTITEAISATGKV